MIDNHGYIKALPMNNIADMVYCKQVFHEPGMLPGMHLTSMPDGIVAIPDKGWIVWYDRGEPLYDTMDDEEFRGKFTPYDALPEKMKAVCDAHPGYHDWCDIMDKRTEEKKKS